MNSFGWMASVDYCSHLSENGKSVFACLLVVPWVLEGNRWPDDPPSGNEVPKGDSEKWKGDFGDWLTPWTSEGEGSCGDSSSEAGHKVTWEIWKFDSVGKEWVKVEASIVPVVVAPDKNQAGRVRQESTRQVHDYVAGHPDAMGMIPKETEGFPIFTYPIAISGLADQPAVISDEILGVSAILSVSGLEKGEEVIAAPVFTVKGGREVKPQKVSSNLNSIHHVHITYGENINIEYSELRCYTRAIKVGEPIPSPQQARPVAVSYGMPELAVYAEVARLFFPASVWISALLSHVKNDSHPNPSLNYPKFLTAFVRLLGCGEEELFWDNGIIFESESILQYLKPDKDLKKWFGEGFPEGLRKDFLAKLAEDGFAKEVLTAFWKELEKVGLKGLEEEVIKLKDCDPAKLGLDALQAAWRVAVTLTLNNSVARAVWGCWLVCICQKMCKIKIDDVDFNNFLEKLRTGARYLVKNPDAPDTEETKHTLKPGECLEMLEGLLDYVPEFWEKLHKDTNICVALKAIQESFINNLNERTELKSLAAVKETNSSIENKIKGYIDDQCKSIQAAFCNPKKLADDQPLTLHFGRQMDPNASPVDEEEKIRGYILALRAGFPAGSDSPDVVTWLKPEWIDARTAQLVECMKKTKDELQDGQKNPIHVITARGASMSNGLRVVSAMWPEGSSGHESGVDTDKTRGLYNPGLPRLPDGQRPMRLGYGLYYEALAGTLDNAGAIMEPGLRSEPVGMPRNPSSLFTGRDPFRYLSRVVPGLAIFSDFDDLALSKETLVHQHLAQKVFGQNSNQDEPVLKNQDEPVLKQNSNIAVLFSGEGYRQDRAALRITLKPPMCTVPFAERWLNADLTAPKGSNFRWDKVRDFEPEVIEALIEKFKSLVKDGRKDDKRLVTDPSVEKLRVRVTWYNEKGEVVSDGSDSRDLQLKHLMPVSDNLGESYKVYVNNNAPKFIGIDNDNGIQISVPPGFMAKIDVYSMVPKEYVQEKPYIARFDEDVFKNYYDQNNDYYISKGSATLWVESLPAYPKAEEISNLQKQLTAALTLRYPSGNADDQKSTGTESFQELSVILKDSSQIGARWINGLRVEPKRWQWSGYPVKFPRLPGSGIMDDLNLWVPLYAGTSNDQPRHPSAVFTSKFDAEKKWILKQAVMQPVQLPALRVPMHLGLEVTPVPRFESLLAEKVIKQYADFRVHLYATVPGTAIWKEDTRLSPPVWREAIPLPQTVVPVKPGDQGWKFKSTGKGVLLLLDGAMYDTDDTASWGGVAERMELDIVGTWVSKAEGRGNIEEMGVNPIFHAPTQPKELKLVLDPPFGLGYDLGKGGNPVQTGLIVRSEGGDGQWLLAKCRLRRMILPEFVSGSFLSSGSSFNLPVRRSDEEWVPWDFVVETDGKLESITLTYDTGSTRTYNNITIPPLQSSNGRCCYLVSWHKGRWTSANPTWRAQVNHYQLHEFYSEWIFTGKATPFEQSDLSSLTLASKVEVTIQGGENVQIRKILVSDFTEPKWISFIGNFGNAELEHAESYQIRREKDKFRLEAKNNAALPILQPKDQLCSSLLLIFSPVPDVMRGQLEEEGGELRGVYAISSQEFACQWIFDSKLLELKGQHTGYRAVVIQAQRCNTEEKQPTKPDQLKPQEWEDLVGEMFPWEARNEEAKLRLLPEYIGPIKIID